MRTLIYAPEDLHLSSPALMLALRMIGAVLAALILSLHDIDW